MDRGLKELDQIGGGSGLHQVGIDLYLLKPVRLEVLVRVLDRFWRVIGPVVVG